MAGTHFKGPIYSNGLEIPTLNADGTSPTPGVVLTTFVKRPDIN